MQPFGLGRTVQSLSKGVSIRISQPPNALAQQQRPSHHQISTLYAADSFRRRHNRLSGNHVTVQVRDISYYPIPRIAIRAISVVLVGAIIVVAVPAYAQYKYEKFKEQVSEHVDNARVVAHDAFKSVSKSASHGYKTVSSRVSTIEVPVVKTPQFLKNFLSVSKEAKEVTNGDKSHVTQCDSGANYQNEGSEKQTPAWVDSARGVAHNVFKSASKSASDGVKAVSPHISAVKAHVGRPQFLNNLLGQRKNEGKKAENDKAISTGENESHDTKL